MDDIHLMPVPTELDAVVRADASLDKEQLFPIREVARLTGINPVTLRAWERRYGLIQPTRTGSGHRLYSMTDIETVRSIMSWIDRGVSVSKVGKILSKASPAQVLEPIINHEQIQLDYAEWQADLRGVISQFDVQGLDRVYGQVFSSYPVTVVFQDILMPLWQQLQRQQERFGAASEWLFYDSFLRSRTLQRLQAMRHPQQRVVVMSALTGQGYELELLVAALMLGCMDLGMRVLTLGQPLDELALVCGKIKPAALVLFSNYAPVAELPRRLSRLALSLDCPLMLAGNVAELLEESMAGSAVGCLGNEGRLMRQRLQHFLAGNLDT